MRESFINNNQAEHQISLHYQYSLWPWYDSRYSRSSFERNAHTQQNNFPELENFELDRPETRRKLLRFKLNDVFLFIYQEDTAHPRFLTVENHRHANDQQSQKQKKTSELNAWHVIQKQFTHKHTLTGHETM